MTDLKQHLKERHLNVNLYKPTLDEEEGVVTFLLWNLSGQCVGYQQYRPTADKEKRNKPKDGRYFTFRRKENITVWGLESWLFRDDILCICEGIFDACRLHNYNIPAVAILSNDANSDLRGWLKLTQRKIIAVCDNDEAGNRLAKLAHVAIRTDAHDLGDASEQEVNRICTEILKIKET